MTLPELGELYREVILDHYRRPRNFRVIDEGARRVEGHNPLCGDHVTVYLRLDGDVIQDIAFQGTGCAISQASASLMTSALKGKTRQEAEQLFQRFHRLVTGASLEPDGPELGKLEVFSGVSAFPIRVKCASLPWHAMHAALEGRTEAVSTE